MSLSQNLASRASDSLQLSNIALFGTEAPSVSDLARLLAYFCPADGAAAPDDVATKLTLQRPQHPKSAPSQGVLMLHCQT